MIHLDFNIVLQTKGGVFVTISALKSYTLKLEMATSILLTAWSMKVDIFPIFESTIKFI